MVEYVSFSYEIDVKKYISPWSDFFNLKNKNSETLSISCDWARRLGYKNPIDSLGENPYNFKVPIVELAGTFITQDNAIITQNKEEKYIMLALLSPGCIEPIFYTKKPLNNCLITNHKLLNPCDFTAYFLERITAIDLRYYKKIQSCYRVVDNYEGLSARETSVMYYLMLGMNSTKIGEILGLSKRTIQHYVDTIKFKMNCNTSQQLVELGLYIELNKEIPELILK